DAVVARDLVGPFAVGQVVYAEGAVAYDELESGGCGVRRRLLLLLMVREERRCRRSALRAEEGARARVAEGRAPLSGRERRRAARRRDGRYARGGLRLVDRAEEAVEEEEREDEDEGDEHPRDGAQAERAPDLAEYEVVQRYPPD